MTTEERNEIEALLAALDEARRRIHVAQAYGVQRAGLRDVKGELRSTRRRLAELVWQRGTAASARAARVRTAVSATP